MEQVEVSVEELLRGLRERGVPLPFEIGAFIALEVSEQMLDRPMRIDAREVGIGDVGEVLCPVRGAPVSEESAVRSLVVLLSELLVLSPPGVPAMLLELVERGPSGGQFTLDRLRDDLEASLVPLNRGATRRVLARLCRDARRSAAERESEGPAPEASDIDAQFDALIGATPGPAASRAGSSSSAPRGSFAREDDGASARDSAFGPRSERPSPDRDAALRALRTAAAVGDTRSGREPDALSGARGATPRARGIESEVWSDPASRSGPPEGREPRGRSARAGDDARTIEPHRARSLARDEPLEHGDDRDSAPGRSARPSERHAVRASERNRRRRRRSSIEPSEPALRSGAPDAPRSGRAARSSEYPELARHGARPPSRRLNGADDLLADVPDHRASRWPAVFGALMVLGAAGLVGAYLALGQAGARRALGLLPVSEPAPMTKEVALAALKQPAGELRVDSNPARAQVLLRIGTGPAVATDLAVGVAQEFVALADGFAPARALVPANATWEEGGGQRRYELAVQASQPLASGVPIELGPTLLPRDVGTPTGELGSVRVVTTPRGAKVYQLIGFTPDVRVENLPLDQPYELLISLPGHTLVQRLVEPSDFSDSAGGRVAQLRVELEPRLRR